MYRIILHKNAAKYYRNASKKLQSRINAAVDTILENPRYHVHIKKSVYDVVRMPVEGAEIYSFAESLAKEKGFVTFTEKDIERIIHESRGIR